MLICICRNISDKIITARAHAGQSFDDMQFDLGLATQCGQCEDCARSIIAKCQATHETLCKCGYTPPEHKKVLVSAAIRNSKAWTQNN